MSLFKSHTLTVNRYSSGYVDGRYTKTFETSFNIQTSWQALTGEDLETLPEGKRAEFSYRGYPDIMLRIADPKKQCAGDIIIGPDNYNYEVIRVEAWQNDLIPHYKFIATRIKENDI